MFDRHFPSWPPRRPRTLTFPDTRVEANLAATAARIPDSIAIHYYGTTMTWQALQDAVDQLAGYLHHTLNVQHGDRVLLYMQNAPQYVIAYYAILRVNAVVVPVNPMNREDELHHIVTDTAATTVLLGDELVSHAIRLRDTTTLRHLIIATYRDYIDSHTIPADIELPEVVAHPPECDDGQVIRWCDAMADNLEPPAENTDINDWCVLPYTSGTTGHPKGCLHAHYGVNAVVLSYAKWLEMSPQSTCLVTLPLFHVTGMQNSMNFPVFIGTPMVIMTRWNRITAARLIEQHRITHWRSITTMMVDFLSDATLSSTDLSSLVSVGGGGAQMPAALAKTLLNRTGLHYIEGYGLSETISATHVNPPHKPRAQCLGVPWFNVDSRVIDPQTGAELGVDTAGEIVVNGAQVFSGYWQQPEATREATIEIDGKTFLRTGDLGYYDVDGYFYMVDRLKRMINASGYKVWPAEVEAMMHAHPQIGTACVIGARDPRRGETVKALVKLVIPNEVDVDAAQIIAWCEQRMSAYKVPRIIEFVSDLPQSGSGKVLWRQLQAEQNDQDLAASHKTP